MRSALVYIVFLLMGVNIHAQLVDKGGIYCLTLHDQTRVEVMPAYDISGSHTYYYLPVNLRLSLRKDQTPEFTFMTFREEEGREISGAILHFLLLWGLTPAQEQEVEILLRASLDSLAMMAGVVSLEVPVAASGVSITGNTKIAEILRTRWSAEPLLPVLPGTKMALSYRFDADEAKSFQDGLDSIQVLDSVQFELKFRFRGGYHERWYSQFKDEYYTVKTTLRDILAPVLHSKKDKK